MNYVIKPQLTMASHMPIRTPEPHDTQTATEIPVPVIIPTLSLRSRIALLMQIVALWLVVAVVITAICLLNVPAIYRFVGVIVAFILGCALSSVIVFSRYRERLADEPRLITQTLSHGDTLTDLEDKVSMSTSVYLRVVRAG